MARNYSCDKCKTELENEDEVIEATIGDKLYDFCNICWGEYNEAKKPLEEDFNRARLDFFYKWLKEKK